LKKHRAWLKPGSNPGMLIGILPEKDYDMLLKIKSVREAWKNENCFCGKKADYNVQLTNSKEHCPVCVDCLMDRLNKLGQSFMINDRGLFLQSFKDDSPLFICRRSVTDRTTDYSVSFYPEGSEEPCNIIAYINGEQKAKKILKELQGVAIDWQGIKRDGKKHAQFKEAYELNRELRKKYGLL
jgi:hypothetical protein